MLPASRSENVSGTNGTDSFGKPVPPGAWIDVLRKFGERTQVESVAEAEALERMQNDLRLDSEEVMQQHLRVWQDLARRLPAFKLMPSQDPHNAADFLREFVAKEL